MPFKTILAVVEYTDVERQKLRAAVDLCHALNAHLSVLVVGQVPGLPFYGYGGQGYAKIWVEESEQRLRALRGSGEKVKDILKQESVSFDVRPGLAVAERQDNLVARHAIYSDLTVILRSRSGTLTALENQTVDGALFESGRPLLLMPQPDVPKPRFRRVLVAWNAKREVARALADAMPFLLKSEEVCLMVIDPEVGLQDHGEEPGADMAPILTRHGLNVSVKAIASEGRFVSDVILTEADQFGADLVIMGAYGHSRLRENILGGTTREMLENSPLPVFLSH